MPKGIYKRTEEQLKRIKSLRRDKVSWNKGLTKATSDILKESGKKISVKRRIRIEPIRTKQWKKNISKAHQGKHHLPMELNPNWKGGRYISTHGYVQINIGNGKKKAEHIILMEQKLGRALVKGEIVHHKDGNKLNNSLDNLYLFASNSEHLKYENKVSKFGKQLLTNLITLEQFKEAIKLV